MAIRQDVFSKRGALTHVVKEINERALGVGRLLESSPPYAPNMDALEQLTMQRAALESDIKKLGEKIADPHKIKLTIDEFLNLRVDNEKVVSYLWREPFATLVKTTEIVSGGAGWIRTNDQEVMSPLLWATELQPRNIT